MQGAFLGEGFEAVHFKSSWLLEDWTAFRAKVIHDYLDNQGGEFDDTSRLLAAFTDGFDHVGDIVSPSVEFSVGGDCVDRLQHLQFKVAASTNQGKGDCDDLSHNLWCPGHNLSYH